MAHRIGELAVMLVLAMSFTYVLRPVVNALMRQKIFANARNGRTWATTLVFVIFGLLIYLICSFTFRSVARDVVSVWNSVVPSDLAGKRHLFEKWRGILSDLIAPYRDALPPNARHQVESSLAHFASAAPLAISTWARASFSHAGFIVELLLLPVLVFYFLADGRAIRREAALLIPTQLRPAAARFVAELDRVLDGYIRGQLIMCLIAWVFVTIGLWLVGVPHAFTLGLIAGLTRAVPIIGPLLGGIPLVLICLLTTRSVPITMTVLIGFIAMHFLESKVLLPKIIGHEVDLHPVSVIVTLLLGLQFFGFMGVFLSVPIAAVAKILLQEWHERQETKPILSRENVIERREIPVDATENTPSSAISSTQPSTRYPA